MANGAREPIPSITDNQPTKSKKSLVTMNDIEPSEPRQHAPSKKGVKGEARHEHAVHELDDAGQDEEDEKSIDEF